MSKQPLVKFSISFGVINLGSMILAIPAGDWSGLYVILVSGPFCGLLIRHMRPISMTGYSESKFAIVGFLVAVVFSAICCLFPKRYMAAAAGGAWVISGFVVAGLKGVFS